MLLQLSMEEERRLRSSPEIPRSPDMSSKSGLWSFTLFRFRSLLQLLQKTNNSDSGCRGSQLSSASDAMVPYTRYHDQSIYQMFRLFGWRTNTLLKSHLTRVKINKEKAPPPTAHSSFFFVPVWAKWVFGSLLSLFIPTWKQSLDKLQALEDEAEVVIEEAESVAEVVEKLAKLTEKVSGDIVHRLPNESRLKETAQVVEHYSKEIAHDAHLTQDFLHKVEKWEQKLDKSEAAINGLVHTERIQSKQVKDAKQMDQ